MDFLFNNNKTNPFLSVYTVGYEETKPNHNYGPAIRSGYMLHYIYSGEGKFICNGTSYHLKQGDFFFISPHATIQYISDEKNPWSYYWFGFRGDLAEYYLKETSISSQHPVFSNETSIKSHMNKLIEISLISEDNDMMLNSCLLEILYELSQHFPKNPEQEKPETKNMMVAKALSFMRNNYENAIKISDIAQHLNIDRTYLHRIFISEVGTSPKQYLTNIRLQKAQELLTETNLPIKNIAYSIGFEDSGNFSKLFKATYQMTPMEYRLKMQI